MAHPHKQSPATEYRLAGLSRRLKSIHSCNTEGQNYVRSSRIFTYFLVEMVDSFVGLVRMALLVTATAAVTACAMELDLDSLRDDPPSRPFPTTGTGVVVGFPREKVDFKEFRYGDPIGRLSVGDSVSFYLRFNPSQQYAPLDQVLDTARNVKWSVFAAGSGNGAFGDSLATIQTRDAGRGVLIARGAATTVEVRGNIGGEYYGGSTVLSCVGVECIRVVVIIR